MSPSSERPEAKLNQTSWLQYILLLTIVIIAAALRFYKLGEWSFWIEEIHTVRDSLAISINNLGTKPLFYLLDKPLLILFGVNEWTARVPSALAGVISVPVLYIVIKRIVGFQVAILSVLLLAISPWHIFWSQTARFYTLLLLFFNLALVLFFWGIETDRLGYIVGSILCWGLAVLSHTTGVLVAIIAVFYFFLLKFLPIEKPQGLRFRNLALFLVIPFLGYASLELLTLLSGKSLFISRFMASFSGWFVGRTVYGSYELLVNTGHNIGPPLAFLAFIGGFYSLKNRDRFGLFLILSLSIPMVFMLIATQFVYVNWRYLFFTLPAWTILGAVGVKELYFEVVSGKKYWLWLVALGVLIMFLKANVVQDTLLQLWQNDQSYFILGMAILALLLISVLLFQFRYFLYRSNGLVWIGIFFLLLLVPLWSTFIYFEYSHGNRENWREAAAFIEERKLDEDTVVSYLPSLPNYYLNEKTAYPHNLGLAHLGREAENTYKIDVETVLQRNENVWVFEEYGMSHSSINETPFPEWSNEHCKLLYDDMDRGWIRVHLCPGKQSTVTSSLSFR